MRAILNAYNAYLDEDNVDNVYNQLMTKCNGVPCAKCTCVSLSHNGTYGRDKDRRNRDDTYRTRSYTNMSDMHMTIVVYHQFLDSIHVALYHAFDCGFRVRESGALNDCDTDDAKEKSTKD
eukprot:99887_1